MNRIFISLRSKHLMLVSIGTLVGGLAIASRPVIAQQGAAAPELTQEITVVAPYVVQKKDVGRTSTGIPVQVVSMSTPVSYSDLDLTTQSGAAELRKRIGDAAKAACGNFKTKYPLTNYKTSDRECVKDATMEAMAVATLVIADAAGK
jgi:UrcA family protein